MRIYRDNLVHNFLALRQKGGGAMVMAVVKADAYGHGDVEIARTLERAGCDMLGVATVDEGARLRQAGVARPVVVLGGVYPGEMETLFERDLTPVVWDAAIARTIDAVASRRGETKAVHVKIDTGMGRLGLSPDAESITAFFTALRGFASLRLGGVMSHLADAENEDQSFSRAQIEAFLAAIEVIKGLGFIGFKRHMANGAAIVDLPGAALDLTRPGLMLYGVYPAERFRLLVDLKPVMEFTSRITRLRSVPEGFSVSYGRRFRAGRPSLIATVPAGYADGVPRRLSCAGSMLVRGQRAPIAGVVCMDMTMLDVTDVAGVAEGDEVAIIGRQGAQEITALEVAGLVGTIPYEILTNIGPRVPREYC